MSAPIDRAAPKTLRPRWPWPKEGAPGRRKRLESRPALALKRRLGVRNRPKRGLQTDFMTVQAHIIAHDRKALSSLGGAMGVSKTMMMTITPCQPGAGRSPI